MKRSGRAAILGTLVLGLALGVGPLAGATDSGNQPQVVQITAVAGYSFRWSPADITIKSGEVTFAVTNSSSYYAHFFAVLNANEKKVAETTPQPDEVSCEWNGVSVGCGRTIPVGETQVTFKLSAGKYTYICFIHATGGQFRQVGTLTVQD